MSVVSTAATILAANQALNAQEMKMAAVKLQNEAAQSVMKMLEEAIDPAEGADKTKIVDVKA
jgi:hypothetical protein